eukprot:TRINITY_DN22514_c0_g1_i1.p1 TRINITY_DN22514_c0_g1~~TRINITY_DN22514_c0_g1_i1.p1  ORF type:complete len:184 (-),score=20.44 TRINITY_DN22514_c0_g1_i1:93-644(-)
MQEDSDSEDDSGGDFGNNKSCCYDFWVESPICWKVGIGVGIMAFWFLIIFYAPLPPLIVGIALMASGTSIIAAIGPLVIGSLLCCILVILPTTVCLCGACIGLCFNIAWTKHHRKPIKAQRKARKAARKVKKAQKAQTRREELQRNSEIATINSLAAKDTSFLNHLPPTIIEDLECWVRQNSD